MNDKFDFETSLNKLEASDLTSPQKLEPVAETELGDALVQSALPQEQPSLATPINIPKAANSAAPKKTKPKTVTAPEPLPPEKSMHDDDEFSPENLRVLNTMDLKDLLKVELVEIAVRKPKKDEWFRVLPGHFQQGGILEIQRETYWVSPKIQSQFLGDPCFSVRICVLAVTKQGVPFIWPLRPDCDAGGKSDKSARAPLAAMQLAQEKWTRIYWVKEKFEYLIETADISDEPKFPEKSFSELLRLGFKASIISTLDHPALLELKGRAS